MKVKKIDGLLSLESDRKRMKNLCQLNDSCRMILYIRRLAFKEKRSKPIERA